MHFIIIYLDFLEIYTFHANKIYRNLIIETIYALYYYFYTFQNFNKGKNLQILISKRTKL